MAHTLEVTQFSDLLHQHGRRFTREEWKDWVLDLHTRKLNEIPSDRFMESQADKYEALLKMVWEIHLYRK